MSAAHSGHERGAQRVRLKSLGEALDYLHGLDASVGLEVQAGAQSNGARETWTLPQVLVHCAQSIEYSLSGYPKPKSRLVQSTLGKLAKQTFLRRGAMSHNRAAIIPGAPAIEPDVTRSEAMARLVRAIDAFEAFQGSYAPHFTFGAASKEEYEVLHAIHIADHLSAFPAGAQASQVQA